MNKNCWNIIFDIKINILYEIITIKCCYFCNVDVWKMEVEIKRKRDDDDDDDEENVQENGRILW